MKDFLVSKADDGRVWVANELFTVVKGPSGWEIDAPSADDLKDNFSPVEGKEAETLFQEASAAVSDNPNLLRVKL